MLLLMRLVSMVNNFKILNKQQNIKNSNKKFLKII